MYFFLISRLKEICLFKLNILKRIAKPIVFGKKKEII